MVCGDFLCWGLFTLMSQNRSQQVVADCTQRRICAGWYALLACDVWAPGLLDLMCWLHVLVARVVGTLGCHWQALNSICAGSVEMSQCELHAAATKLTGATQLTRLDLRDCVGAQDWATKVFVCFGLKHLMPNGLMLLPWVLVYQSCTWCFLLVVC